MDWLGCRWVGCALLTCSLACQRHSSGDGDGSESDTQCYSAGVGEDGQGIAPDCCFDGCCGDPCCGDPCCGDPCCGIGNCEDGSYCTTDEECGEGLLCQDGICVAPPQDVLPTCGSGPERAELAFGAGVQTQPGALALMDFNGDKVNDLVIARGDGTVAIWIEAGGGAFSEEGPFYSGTSGRPRGMSVVDLDADGFSDIALIGDTQPGQLNRLYNDGMGMFVPEETVTAGAHPTALATADFNGDGHLDIALLNSELEAANVINLLYSDGAGGFLVPLDIPLAQPPLDFVVAEIDGNDIPDLVVANAQGVLLLAGRPSGGFDEVVQLTAGPGATAAGVVVRGQDIVRAATVAGVGEVALWRWNGDETATAPFKTYGIGQPLGTVVIGDLDEDGRKDIIAGTAELDPTNPTGAPAAIIAMFADGEGGLGCQLSYPIAKAPVDLLAGDLNGDGMADIAAASGVDTLSILLSG